MSDAPYPSSPTQTSGQHIAAATALGGTPLGIVTVLLWESYHPGKMLEPVAAAALGSVGAAFFGYFWLVLTTLISRWLQLPK